MAADQNEGLSIMVETGNPLLESKHFNAVGALLRHMLRAGDERIEFTISATEAVTNPEVLAYNPKGEFETSAGRANSLRGSIELWDATDQLRAASYRAGVGTWFSARITVNADSSAGVNYNYDDEPDWGSFPIDPVAYVTDQEKFPRDEAKQPAWLKEKLAEGRAKLAARGN